MKTDTSTPNQVDSQTHVPTDTVFALLLEERRRYALEYLTRKVGAVTFEELAEAIAVREGDRTPDNLERVSTALHHAHLPKLVDAGVVAYDPETGRIERRQAAAQLEAHLELIDDDEQ